MTFILTDKLSGTSLSFDALSVGRAEWIVGEAFTTAWRVMFELKSV